MDFDFAGLEVVELYGLRVPIDPRLMSEKIIESLSTGRYEKGEAERLPRLVRPGERVVEIGAGIGLVTAIVATRTPAELVVAIEANPALPGYIAALHRLNGASTVIRQALVTPAPADGPAVFKVHRDLWASTTGWVNPKNCLRSVETPSISLSDIAAEYRPSLLVVDLEPLAAWTAATTAPYCLAAADFRPFERVLIELKPKRFAPPEVKRVFDHFSAQGFAYSPAFSHGPLVLFERVGS